MVEKITSFEIKITIKCMLHIFSKLCCDYQYHSMMTVFIIVVKC